MNLPLAGVPVLLALAALLPGDPARTARVASLLAFLGAVGVTVTGAASDTPQAVMGVLVTGLLAVIARYSSTYLRGDPAAARYARWFLATGSAVTTVVAAEDLGVLAVAWTATSLALHQLLTLYPERPAAQMAAHKKFLVSRLADACMAGACLLLWHDAGSLDLRVLAGWATAGGMQWTGQAAMVLLVVAVALKSAQLPFHGWLLQVMEAPTPVSALLHAGIVNVGGYVLLRLSPVLAQAPAALTLLVVAGTTTAVLASLVRTTRVSVKVALAWSTCAQMGFLLLECGLGATSLALLHIVGHSVYKAHAFLSAGGTVDRWRAEHLAPRPAPVPLAAVALAGAVVTGLAALLVGPSPDPNTLGFTTLLVLAVTPLVARAGIAPLRAAPGLVLRAAGVVAVTTAWHLLLPHETAPWPALWSVALAGFAALFSVQTALAAAPDGPLARSLQPALFAGLYLDEIFTRLTFRVWPPSPVTA